MESEASLLVDPSPYWDSEEADYKCDCPGPPPPPQFRLPPPPAPPTSRQCQGGYDSDLPYCHIDLVEAEYSQTPFPSLPVIAVCSSIIAVALLVAIYVLWRHKKKVQNFLPCNHKPKDRCDLSGSNGVTYDDVLIHHHPTRLPPHGGPEMQSATPFELFDLKYDSYNSQMTPLRQGDFPYPLQEVTCGRNKKTKDHFNPIYEEVSGGSDERADTHSYNSDMEDSEVERRTTDSEDDFAEDELSLAREEGSRPCSGTSSVRGSTGGDLCKDVGSSDGEGVSSEEEERRGLFKVQDSSVSAQDYQDRSEDSQAGEDLILGQKSTRRKGSDSSYRELATNEEKSPFQSPTSLWYGAYQDAYDPENWPREKPVMMGVPQSETKNRERSTPQFSTFHPVNKTPEAENIYCTIDDDDDANAKRTTTDPPACT
ncbi:uncharacterized protein LOC111637260 [Centruroides sculpturatus]|uniref:uncharacterized protein LOC111637260 n=1 Tax=Centruroides sculpturatus TaxID=218467 RepID=UPI000C6E936F|nr:uncharacterized protein LOC111637260 [Centruroides sculpturatus]XP_023238480.1 uncharacterized protein LOC111637260 [Centruroides sculpturatus]XP_023238481.1 uncharacterized protein LOC111637260 [Centruroides sculpturatus]